MNKDELKKEIEQYLINLQITYDTFNLYKEIKTSVNKYPKEIKSISPFLQICLYSLETTFFISLNKYFLKSDEKNIYNLLNLCKKNFTLFPKNHNWSFIYPETNQREIIEEPFNILEDINKIEKELKTYTKTIQNLRKIRNKYYAHADKNYFEHPEVLFERYNIKNTDIENLINTLYNSLNKILNDLCSEVYYFNDKYIDNIEYIFEHLKK